MIQGLDPPRTSTVACSSNDSGRDQISPVECEGESNARGGEVSTAVLRGHGLTRQGSCEAPQRASGMGSDYSSTYPHLRPSNDDSSMSRFRPGNPSSTKSSVITLADAADP